MNIEEYSRITRPHERLLRQLLLDLQFHIQDLGQINVFAIDSRIKSYSSALRKSQRKNTPVEQLKDLAGIRVIVGTKSEVELIARFLYRMQDSKDLNIVRDENISKDDGYNARHIIVSSRGNYLRSMYNAWVEVQLRTTLQHAFDSISRAWSYNSDRPYSAEWRMSFVQLSERLKEADDTITFLQDEVVKLVTELGDNDPLSPLAVQRIIHLVFNESINLNAAVDECRFYVDLGADTVGKLKSFVQDQRIVNLRGEFESAARSGNEIAAQMLKLPLHLFWSSFGTRLEAARELVLRGLQK